MSEEYIRLDRLVVVFQFLAIPIYFFSLSNFMPTILIPFIWDTVPILNDLIIRIIIPTLFSLPIVIFTWYKRYVLSDTYVEISNTIWKLPTGIKAFYGFNFIIICIFGLPIFAPIIGLLGGYFLGLLIFGNSDDKPNISRPKIKLTTSIYLPIAIILSIIFYLQVWEFYEQLILIWKDNITVMYLSALNLADAVIITSLFILIFEIRNKYYYSSDTPPIGALIAIISFMVLEVSLVFFYYSGDTGLSQDVNLVFNLIHISAFLLSIGLLITRWILNITQDSETGNSLYAWITIIIFQLVNIASGDIQLISRTVAILLTCVVFMGLFVLTYREVSKSY